jgi:hypothetical protein
MNWTPPVLLSHDAQYNAFPDLPFIDHLFTWCNQFRVEHDGASILIATTQNMKNFAHYNTVSPCMALIGVRLMRFFEARKPENRLSLYAH